MSRMADDGIAFDDDGRNVRSAAPRPPLSRSPRPRRATIRLRRAAAASALHQGGLGHRWRMGFPRRVIFT
jgi:hypothetical protein